MTDKSDALDPNEPVAVVATATGALPIVGIKQPGDPFDVPLMGFSARWMKPANTESAKRINAWRKAHEA